MSRSPLRRNTFTVAVLACAVTLLSQTSEAQAPCNQVGNHTIRIGKIKECEQLADCDAAPISKGAKHAVTWVATGNYTFTIEFPQGSPFDNFSCQDAKRCTSGPAADSANPGSEYKYNITLKQDGNVVCVQDPRILIQN